MGTAKPYSCRKHGPIEPRLVPNKNRPNPSRFCPICTKLREEKFKASGCKNHPERRRRARGFCCTCLRNARAQEIGIEAVRAAERVEGKRWRETGDNRKRDAYHSRKRGIRRKYGLSLEDYDVLVKAQNNLCASCGKLQSTKVGRLAIDHDHKTGKVRALLCNGCNFLIGQLENNLTRFNQALAYLAAYSTTPLTNTSEAA